tara:strand:- start:2160 stop:2387 length:228 start_codon:yes stop_codon:yes gene_type:complete
MFWLIFKIRDWFRPPPVVNARLSEKLKEHQKKKKLANLVEISESSHTPTTKSANHETTEHDRQQHENQKNSEQTE